MVLNLNYKPDLPRPDIHPYPWTSNPPWRQDRRNHELHPTLAPQLEQLLKEADTSAEQSGAETLPRWDGYLTYYSLTKSQDTEPLPISADG